MEKNNEISEWIEALELSFLLEREFITDEFEEDFFFPTGDTDITANY